MRLIVSFLFIAGFLGGLASCQSLSKEECQVADWQAIGQSDGAAGYEPQSRFAKHVKACARINIMPDQTLWRHGYDMGLVRYCTPMSGLTAGKAGKSYANVCPPATSTGFLRGYNLGHAAYSKERQINSEESTISRLRYDISDLEARGRASNDHAELDAIGAQISSKQRLINDAERRIDRLRYELAQINRDIDWFSSDPSRDIPSRYY